MAEGSVFTDFVDPTFAKESHSQENTPDLASWEEVHTLIKSDDRKKLKALVRKNQWGVGHPIRQHLWAALCLRHQNMGRDGHDIATQGSEAESNLPACIDRTLIQQYKLTSQGHTRVHNIVRSVCGAKPDITYAPQLYNMCALFIHYMDEIKAQQCIEELLSRPGEITQSHISHETSAHVLCALLKRHSKKTYQWLKHEADVTSLEGSFTNWQLWIYRDMPLSHLVRVMDCYLTEGIKVLYRAALAILILFHKHAQKSSRSTSIDERISDFCRNNMAAIAIQIYLQTSFSIRALSRKEITRLTQKKEHYVTSVHSSRSLQSADLQAASKVIVQQRSRTFDHSLLESTMLTGEHWDTLWQWLPERITLFDPTLLFSTSLHGTSLNTFYKRIEDREHCPATLLVIKTTQGKVFGAYCSTDWDTRLQQDRTLSFFGTGESFVFTLSNSDGSSSKRYPWVGVGQLQDPPPSASLFMAGDNTQVLIGGGGGVAIRLDADLCHGTSERSHTFNNPPLPGHEQFTAATVEVFGFTSA